ncbi:MAG TPA: SpoIIE family protein phosphatase, partial [Acidimicrobiales bacterium]|nr:SpoIIE family protein phosphatase [Acidimicrobiales bacterium]
INDVLADCTDRREVMRRICATAVPRLGDWCTMHVFLDQHDSAPAVEVGHVDPSMVEVARELQARFPYDPAARTGVPAVIRTGEPEIHYEISDERLAGMEISAARIEAARRLSLRSAITVPLSKRHQVIGAMQFVLSGDQRRYSEDDVALAVAVAGRVASSLDNLRLAEIQRHISETLQRSLLPDTVPEVPGAEVAVRYWAAGEGTEVGGDFYDIFTVDTDTTAFVIGDVCGKGPAAAALTGQVRHTIRAYARRGEDHLGLLDDVNEALRQSGTDTFCTVAYATLSSAPDGLDLAVACAGHELPLVVRPDGSSNAVGQPGLMLGPFEDGDRAVVAVPLDPGDTVILYTDGVGDLPPPHGLDADEVRVLLSSAVVGAPSAEEAADRIAATLDEHLSFARRDDDIALIVIRAVGRS